MKEQLVAWKNWREGWALRKRYHIPQEHGNLESSEATQMASTMSDINDRPFQQRGPGGNGASWQARLSPSVRTTARLWDRLLTLLSPCQQINSKEVAGENLLVAHLQTW